MMCMLKSVEHLGQNTCKGSIMDDKNELTDIVLNKKNNSKSGKKIILVIAVLAIIFIIVIAIMNIFSPNTKNNLPAINKIAKLPKLPSINQSDNQLFKPVKVIQDNNTTATTSTTLDQIAQKIKAQNNNKAKKIKTKIATPMVVKTIHKTKATKVRFIRHTHNVSKNIKKYIQVGAFFKFKPNKKFLKSIKKHGYKYIYKKVTIGSRVVTKVLVGPFTNKTLIKKALIVIKKEINHHAYITNK